jgi:thioredoxin reductase
MKTVIVVGGGLAGLQAGVFTAKAGEKTLVLDTDESLVYNTSNIQNMVGHDSIGGHQLINQGREKLDTFGGEFKEEEVKKVERTDEGFKVTTTEAEYESEYVVLATAGNHEPFEPLDLEYEDGVEGPYMMEKHVVTDGHNKAKGTEKVFVAGLTNTWEYQTAVAIGEGAKAAVNLLTDKYEEPYEDHDT